MKADRVLKLNWLVFTKRQFMRCRRLIMRRRSGSEFWKPSLAPKIRVETDLASYFFCAKITNFHVSGNHSRIYSIKFYFYFRVLVDRALFLENLAFSESNGYNLELSRNTCVPIGVRRFWYTRLQTPFCRILGIVTVFMTFFVLFSECTFFVVSYTLSPAAFVTEYASTRFHYKYTQVCNNYFILIWNFGKKIFCLQFVAFGIIVYLITSAYFTIFRLQIYKYYHLDPNGHTDENSILFSAM